MVERCGGCCAHLLPFWHLSPRDSLTHLSCAYCMFPITPPPRPHTHRDAHDAMGAVAQFISVEEVNAVARSLLTFASDVGREAEVLELAGQPDQEGLWARPGPTR